MPRGQPFFMIGRMECRRFGRHGRRVMAFAADAGSQTDARSSERIIWIGGMISGRTMATLALHAHKVWRQTLTDESGWRFVAHRVTRQATGFLVRVDPLERFEGTGMRRIHHRVMNLPMTLRTSLSAGVRRRRGSGGEQAK